MTLAHANPFAQPSELAQQIDQDDLVVNGRYRLPTPPGEKGTKAGISWYSRASNFGRAIVDTYNLNLWKERMTAHGLVLRPDILATIANLGDPNGPNKDKINAACEEARKGAGSDIGANLGTALHGFAEEIDRGRTPNVPPTWKPHMAAYSKLRSDYGLEVVENEEVIVNLTYGIAGRFDRIERLSRDLTFFVDGQTVTLPAGTLVVDDIKSGKDPKKGALEIAVQLHVYASADWIYRLPPEGQPILSGEYAKMPEGVHQDYALVVHLPAQGENAGKATLLMVNLAKGRALAELCLMVRNARNTKGLMTEVAVADGAELVASPLRVVSERVEPTIIDQIREAPDEATLRKLWTEAMATKQDNSVTRSAIAARMKELAA